jgi:hypothetical protein
MILDTAAALITSHQWPITNKCHTIQTAAVAGSDKLVIACTNSGPCTPTMVCFSMPPCKQLHHTGTADCHGLQQQQGLDQLHALVW